VPRSSEGIAVVFAALALVQVGWAVAAVVHPTRMLLALAIPVNGLLLGGYVASVTSGVPINLQEARVSSVLAIVAAALELLLVAGSARLSIRLAVPRAMSRTCSTGVGPVGLVTAVAVVAVFTSSVR
jgi:hypothetical protein